MYAEKAARQVEGDECGLQPKANPFRPYRQPGPGKLYLKPISAEGNPS
jgi:hypothetical protein